MGNYNKNSKTFVMAAYCGTNCAICECALAAENPKLMEYLISRGIPAEKLPCPGCREVEGMCPAIGEKCETYNCAKEKGLDFCFECADYPCGRLNPAADRADVLPHNVKCFNLAIIQNKGLEKFAEESVVAKEKYYKGKMSVGRGPKVEG